MQLLDTAVNRYGAPVQVLTDQVHSLNLQDGESAFRRHCMELGIEYITASVRRPTTCGKIEAFHRAYQTESHLFKKHWTFIRYYNFVRPHEAIKYLTPADIYLKTKV